MDGSKLQKWEEIKWSTARQKDTSETEGKVYKTVIWPAMPYGEKTWDTTKR